MSKNLDKYSSFEIGIRPTGWQGTEGWLGIVMLSRSELQDIVDEVVDNHACGTREKLAEWLRDAGVAGQPERIVCVQIRVTDSGDEQDAVQLVEDALRHPKFKEYHPQLSFEGTDDVYDYE